MRSEVGEVANASWQIVRIGKQFVYAWKAVAYIPGDPTPRRGHGFTYTDWGARRAVRRFLLL